MRDARNGSSANGHALVRMIIESSSVFGRLFGRRDGAAPGTTVTRRVVIEGYRPPPPPPPRATPPSDPLKGRLLFQGLHENVDPAESVRTGHMTCPSCDHQFRYFLNSNGTKTLVRCPLCTKQYRL